MKNQKTEYFFKEGCFIEEWSNSAEHPQMSIARVRLEPNTSTLLHALANTEERYVIIRGRGLITVGEQSWNVMPKDVIVIPADQAQKIQNLDDQDLLFLAICTPRFVPENYQTLVEK